MKIRLWHSTISGALIGLAIGVALQIGMEIQQARELERVTAEFAPWSPPLMISILRPHVIPVAVCVMFAALGSSVHVAWSRRHS